MLKFSLDELEPGQEYAVLLWQGDWHLMKVDAISATNDLTMRWLACGMGSLQAAEDARFARAEDAKLRAKREAAGVCVCGRPYDQH